MVAAPVTGSEDDSVAACVTESVADNVTAYRNRRLQRGGTFQIGGLSRTQRSREGRRLSHRQWHTQQPVHVAVVVVEGSACERHRVVAIVPATTFDASTKE